MSDRTLIIAEAGVNHNGSLELAKLMIDAAANAGADVVKFQTFSADRLVTRSAEKAEYQVKETGDSGSQYEMLKRLELTPEMHRELIMHCGARNIDFLSTGFDIESLDLLEELGQSRIKIPSGEITNLPYLRHIGKLGKPVLLSTGMSDMNDIESALSALEQSGLQRSDITVLHCTTAYPAKTHEVNLLAMQTISTAFGVKIGYSDHTLGIEVAVAAVALGASVIEKHFTLDRGFKGPDQKASLEPTELTSMIRAIRDIELALGDGTKRPTESEIANMPSARRSLVAAKPIRAGELFTVENVTTKRPGNGISPMRWDEVLGLESKYDFEIDELISL